MHQSETPEGGNGSGTEGYRRRDGGWEVINETFVLVMQNGHWSLEMEGWHFHRKLFVLGFAFNDDVNKADSF